MSDSISQVDLDAARVTLLALKASRGWSSPPGASIRLVGAGPSLSEDEMADHLALASKPLFCTPKVAGSALEIEFQPLGQVPLRLERHRQSTGGTVSYLRAKYREGLENLKIYCHGGGYWMVVPFSTLERWQADYSIDSYSSGVSEIGSPPHPTHAEAWEAGARVALDFGPPPKMTMQITLDLTPPEEKESREEATQRCSATVTEARPLLRILFEHDGLRADTDAFVQGVAAFFGSDIPPQIQEFVAEWNDLKGGAAA
jgi:hypothetical protein